MYLECRRECSYRKGHKVPQGSFRLTFTSILAHWISQIEPCLLVMISSTFRVLYSSQISRLFQYLHSNSQTQYTLQCNIFDTGRLLFAKGSITVLWPKIMRQSVCFPGGQWGSFGTGTTACHHTFAPVPELAILVLFLVSHVWAKLFLHGDSAVTP